MSALTTVGTLRRLRWGYFWPTPTNKIGLPVVWTMLMLVPTFSSTVSNFVNTMPSIVRGLDWLTAKSIRL